MDGRENVPQCLEPDDLRTAILLDEELRQFRFQGGISTGDHPGGERRGESFEDRRVEQVTEFR